MAPGFGKGLGNFTAVSRQSEWLPSVIYFVREWSAGCEKEATLSIMSLVSVLVRVPGTSEPQRDGNHTSRSSAEQPATGNASTSSKLNKHAVCSEGVHSSFMDLVAGKQ